ncbi:LysR family transcriptional regulator [Acidisoma cellulosilytica]|uniref:LysR family transcriptional regulator n=1 Tax=Acidisoma cellulosilyticum TaxID=2802395 RepID=A0A963Z0F6_9PROT|nr:LysR family transcriptional regulator [Acidisoma cellulosilyticum]MCB8879545.1 LysR family transcriptional regulator [Acidisoma cellulosilyticum]
MALDRLTGMAVFRTAVEDGSLAAAGRRHGLSAEMAGRHLRDLETRLGLRLLNRSTRQLSLTDAGRVYLARCIAVLDEIAAAEAEVGAQQTEPRGLLRVAAPLAFGTGALAPAVHAYMARYPDVTLQMDLSERGVDLLGEGFDLALRLGTLPDSGLIARRLATFPLLIAAKPGHPPIRVPADLSGQEMLIYSQTATPDRLALTGPDGKVESIAVSGRVQASDIGFLLELALLGQGLLVAPAFVVERAIAEGRLVAVLPDWHLRDLPLHALVPHRALMAATLRSFIDSMAAWFGPKT